MPSLPTTTNNLAVNYAGVATWVKYSSEKTVAYKYLKVVLLSLIALRIIASVSLGTGQNWDFVNFFNTGVRMFHGESENLYSTDKPIAGERALGTGVMRYTGFPLSAYLFAPLGAFSPRLALLILKLACALFLLLGLLSLYPHFRRLLGPGWQPDQPLSLYLFLTLLFEPFWFAFPVGGQATPLAFLFLALFVSSYAAERSWQPALYLSIAVLVKPFLALTAAFFVLTGDWRFIKRLAICFLIEGALSIALLGLGSHLEFVRVVLEESSRWAVPWSKNSAILAFVGNFWLYGENLPVGLTSAPPMLAVLQAVFKIGILALFIWLVMKVRRSDLEASVRRAHFVTLAILFALLFSSVVWAHYLAFLFIPLLFLFSRYEFLPKGAKILTALIFLSTLRANWWPLTVYLRRMFPAVNTFGEILTVGLYGSGVLILTSVLLMVYYGDLLKSEDPAVG